MFCKWCGGNIAAADTKCRRCGKEVPALSDCGGFYDLVPNAKRPSATATGVSVAVPTDPGRRTAVEPEQPRKKNGSKKLLVTLLIVTSVCFAFCLMFLLTAIGKLSRCNDKLLSMEVQVKGISSAVDTLLLNQGLEGVSAEAPALAEQELVFTVKQTEENAACYVSADADLGAYEDTVATVCEFDKDTGRLESVEYVLEETDASLKLDFGCGNLFGLQSVSVAYEADAAAFGIAVKDGENCKWQYRFDGEEDWEDIDEELYTPSNNAGKTELKMILKELIDEKGAAPELRCEITRENVQGGCVKIVVEGIKLQVQEETTTDIMEGM